MAGDRLARPGRTLLGRRGVADGEDEIHLGRAGLLKFRDMLGPQPRNVVAIAPQHVERKGVQFGARADPGREGPEPAAAQVAQQRLGKDRPGRVAGTEEQHVEAGVTHGGDVLFGGKDGGDEVGPAPAHVEGEVADQRLGRVEIDGIEQRPALPGDGQQARGGQVGEVVGQGVRPEPQGRGDLGRPYAPGGEAHQQAEDRQPVGMAEGGEGMGGAIMFHDSRIMEMIAAGQ